MIPTREDFHAIAGDMTTEYYHTWLLLVILWRNIWRSSATDWSRYRLRIWDMFAERVRQSARMGRFQYPLSGRCHWSRQRFESQ